MGLYLGNYHIQPLTKRLLDSWWGGGRVHKEVLFIIVFNDKIIFKNSNLTLFCLIWSSNLEKLLNWGYKLLFCNDLHVGTFCQKVEKINTFPHSLGLFSLKSREVLCEDFGIYFHFCICPCFWKWIMPPYKVKTQYVN